MSEEKTTYVELLERQRRLESLLRGIILLIDRHFQFEAAVPHFEHANTMEMYEDWPDAHEDDVIVAARKAGYSHYRFQGVVHETPKEEENANDES